MSYPYDGTPIRYFTIPEHYKSVKYSNVNKAIKIMANIGGCSYSAKNRHKRCIPVNPHKGS